MSEKPRHLFAGIPEVSPESINEDATVKDETRAEVAYMASDPAADTFVFDKSSISTPEKE